MQGNYILVNLNTKKPKGRAEVNLTNGGVPILPYLNRFLVRIESSYKLENRLNQEIVPDFALIELS